jgi:phosphoenolpyruvate-protein kinase (PTS system EI component)
MAHDPVYVRFFVGIGIHAFSLDPHYLADVQESVMAISSAQARSFAERLLAEATVAGTSRWVEAERNQLA